MKKNNYLPGVLISLIVVAIFACTKTNDDTKFVSAKDYIKPVKGKYIIYRLDSIITRDFGSAFVTHTYTIKDSVGNVFTDNTGKESFTIFRLQLNPSNNTWFPANTFVLSPRENSVEYVENNLRYVILASPVSALKSWNGNSYIFQSPFYRNSNISSWDFFYENITQPKTLGALTFNNTITVVQHDSTDNKPFNQFGYNSYEKGYEIYADSLGLIYKDIMAWEYQLLTRYSGCKLIKPKVSGSGNDTIPIDCNLSSSKCDSLKNLPNYKVICDTVLDRYSYDGFGIKQTIIGHN